MDKLLRGSRFTSSFNSTRPDQVGAARTIDLGRVLEERGGLPMSAQVVLASRYQL